MKKTNSYITPKNLENILKLFLKAQEKRKSRKKRKNYKSKKYLHEQHRNEQQGNILMTNLNNMIKENQYKQQSGIKQSDDENKIDLNIVKRALEGNPSQAQKLITYNPSIKPLLENYYKSHESGFLRDIENEINRREKIHHTRIMELEEDGKNYKSKKYLHEQHRNEQQGNIIMTNLNNMIKENQYKNNSGIKKSDDENKIDLSIVKRALEENLSQAQKLFYFFQIINFK